jgi:integrase
LSTLEAEFYLRAATGTGLSATDAGSGAGTVTGGAAVPGFSTAMQQYAYEIAQDELNHVRFLRTAITANGGTLVARPNINFTDAFNTLASAAGIASSMAIVAMCTGLRISEVLALRWENLNFMAGTMLVDQAVVNGRIGPTKTETSKDEVPLDGALATIMLQLQMNQGRSTGLVFPSPLTGGCYHSWNDSEAAPQTCR